MPNYIYINHALSRAMMMAAILAAVISFLLAAGCAPTSVPVPNQAAEKLPAAASAPTETPVQPTPTAPAAVTATEKVSAAAVTDTAPVVPTATERAAAPQVPATATAAPAEAVGPTGTPASDKSFNAWCLPLDASVSNASDPLKPPANAKLASLTTDSLILRNLPSNGCIFLYSFSQTAAADLQLEVSESNAPSPFYKVKLEPVAGRPDVLYAFVRHSMIIAPPVQTVTYTFALRDPLGQVLRHDQVKLYAWVPAASGGSSGGDSEDKGGESGGEDCGCTVPLP